MNALEKVVDLLTVIIVSFLVPILYYTGGKRMTCVMVAGQTAEAFMKRVSTSGEITLSVWTELEEKLNEFGCTEILLRRERLLYEPVLGAQDVAERVYISDTAVIEEQLLRSGKCQLQNGDQLWLTMYLYKVPSVYQETVRTGAEYR